jgi:Tol biopolymer transport system component/predicted Ser/Thr protein kinase
MPDRENPKDAPRPEDLTTPYRTPPGAEETTEEPIRPALTALGERYDLLGELGRGGMGVVYKARDKETGGVVALKVLQAEIAARPDVIERFKSELLLARKVTHKNVCRTHELLRFGDTVAISMEYVEGESLRAILKRFGGVPLRRGLEWTAQICSALAEAHAQGVIHRDLKPENIVIARDGTAKVMDFGIARCLEPQGTAAATASALATIIGTPAYMSPEQAEGKPADHRTDIYSLGLVLYEMFTGRRAFDAATPVALMAKHLHETAPPPREVEPLLPAFLARAIEKCLEKDPQQRFPSAAALASVLDKREVPEAAEGEASAAAPLPRGFRRRAWATVGIVAALAFALGLSTSFLRTSPRPYWKLPSEAAAQVLAHGGNVYQAGVSPDGNQFVYVFEAELHLQTIGGGQPRKLTSDGFRKAWPRFSPDGRRIVYERHSREGDAASLYEIELPAGVPRLLLEDAVKGEWSPDGKQLAFIRPSTRQAYVANADGSQPRSLGSSWVWPLSGVSWSPDGKRLALVDDGKVYLVSRDGASRKQVPIVGVSPDERVLAVAFTPDKDFVLVMRPTGGQTHQLYSLSLLNGSLLPFIVGRFDVSNPTFARNGQSVLVTAVEERERIVASRVGPQKRGSLQQLTFGASPIRFRLSPDDLQIAYVDWRGAGRGELWLVNRDGTDPRLLTRETDGMSELAWAPDGRSLVFTGREGLWILPLAVGKPHLLNTFKGSPRSKRHPSYTFDGGHIVFLQTAEGRDNIWKTPAAGGEATPLTTDGSCAVPVASPAGPEVAYYRKNAQDKYELRIVDTRTSQDRLVLGEQVLAELNLNPGLPLRWSRDGRHLFVDTARGLLRVGAAGGRPEPFSFHVGAEFEVDSSQQTILFLDSTFSAQLWLYTDLR